MSKLMIVFIVLVLYPFIQPASATDWSENGHLCHQVFVENPRGHFEKYSNDIVILNKEVLLRNSNFTPLEKMQLSQFAIASGRAFFLEVNPRYFVDNFDDQKLNKYELKKISNNTHYTHYRGVFASRESSALFLQETRQILAKTTDFRCYTASPIGNL